MSRMSSDVTYVTCPVCGLAIHPRTVADRIRNHRRGGPCGPCRRHQANVICGRLAELVIARRLPVKQAAFELGLNVKTTEYHMWVLRRQITRGTAWLVESQ
jgi:hypothetical protein